MDVATKAAFGDDIGHMLQVVNLATAPAHQGKGYGSALMKRANTEVGCQTMTSEERTHVDSGCLRYSQGDRLGCSSWLLSSNIVNTPFYEHCGFTAAKEIIMGDDNPAWTKPPFKMLIVRVHSVVLRACSIYSRAAFRIDDASRT